MSPIAIPNLDGPPAAARPVVDAVQTQIGSAPNLFRLVATSPAALQGYTGLSAALTKALNLRTRSGISLRFRDRTAATTACRPIRRSAPRWRSSMPSRWR